MTLAGCARLRGDFMAMPAINRGLKPTSAAALGARQLGHGEDLERDGELQVVAQAGHTVMEPVGSAAVRNVIERHQPLLGAHGHVHESRAVAKVGRSLCFNPGSEYSEGVLRGALVVLEQRAAALRDNLARLERNLAVDSGPMPPRVTLLDGDYLRATTAAELSWVCGVVDELRSGALTWSEEELVEAAKSFQTN